jgi:hypothetical protein
VPASIGVFKAGIHNNIIGWAAASGDTMSDEAGLSTSAKIASILVLLANYMVTVDASPLGTADMAVSRFYWVLLLVILAVLAVMYHFTKSKSPVQVMGLAYDKSNHKLELTVKNGGDETYCIKSALRLLAPAQEVIESATADGRIPMAAAKASVGNRQLFQLLAEDDSPVVLAPNETRTLTYDLILPQEHLKLDASKNVEVHISYSEGDASPVLEARSDDAAEGFCIKLESGEVVAEAFVLEDLVEALRKSPDEAVSYHMKNGNDLALWVRNVVGDRSLAEELEQVTMTTPSETRTKLVGIIDSKVESLKHPYLRKVGADMKFVLKTGHDNIVKEVEMLEELANTLAASSSDAVAFHTREGNDFSAWIAGAVGDNELAEKVAAIKMDTHEETKNKLISAIWERVDTLKCSDAAK